MLRRLAALGLLALISLCSQAATPLTGTRWIGQWGDGIRDALTLHEQGAKQMGVHYWRKLGPDNQHADIEFDAMADIEHTAPLTLFWKINGDPQQGSMRLTYDATTQAMTLQYMSAQEGGSMRLHPADTPHPVEACTRPASGTHPVTFTLHAPTAKTVYLAGEMNDWQQDTLPMQRDAQGNWQLTVHLTDGDWAYKFIQDEQWVADPQNPAHQSDGHGGFNSVRHLGQPDRLYQPHQPASDRGSLTDQPLISRYVGATHLLIYRPAGVPADRPLPWVLLLHGYGMNRHQWVEDGQLPNLLDNLIAQQQLPPMAVVMVEGGTGYYRGNTERYLMEELLPQAARWQLSTDPRQRAVMGMSMGGFGAFYLAYRHPQDFATSIALSGYFDMTKFAQWQPAAARKMHAPVLYCGEQDHISTSSNQALQQNLQQAGIEIPFLFAAGGHTWHYWQSVLPDALRRIGATFQSAG